LLLGLRYDYFRGRYQSFQTAVDVNLPIGTVNADLRRSDGEWSERFGVLYQPTPTMTYYFSYGTSFNTSGDTYAYDLPGSNTPPESSRNIELGAKLDLFNNLLSTRLSIFNITKYHERNRTHPPAHRSRTTCCRASGTTGFDIDTPGASRRCGTSSCLYLDPERRDRRGQCRRHDHLGERVGRSSLAPRNSGSI
jgi:catecholate siderophore receptor